MKFDTRYTNKTDLYMSMHSCTRTYTTLSFLKQKLQKTNYGT